MNITFSAHKEDEKQYRNCALSGEKMPKAKLLRFVKGPGNKLIVDIKTNLPGRGLWITANKQTVKNAVKKGIFTRQFKDKLEIDPDLTETIEDLLAKAALGRLKMTNKAGEVVYGFTKLMAALEKETIIALIHASEAKARSYEKISSKFGKINGSKTESRKNGQHQPFICFSGEELSLAFGAANVIHAGLKHGGAANAAITAMQKYIAYQDE